MLPILSRMFGRFKRNGASVQLDLHASPSPGEVQPIVGSQTNQLFGQGNLLGDLQEILGVFNPRLVGIRDKLLMRQDPDIAFGLAIVTAPILNLEWSIQSDDPIIKEFVRMILDRIFRQLALGMSTAVGFGWQAGEKVWDVQDEQVEIQGKDGAIERKSMPNAWIITKTKALDPRTLSLLVDRNTDAWSGIEQSFFNTGQQKNQRIGLFNSLLWSFRREEVWGNLRGWPLLWQAYAPWWAYIATDLFANRYFQRKGDPSWKAHGGPEIQSADGKKLDGFAYIAAQATALQSSGSVVLPNTRDPVSGELMWDINEMNLQQRGDMFDRRLQFLSVKKLRGLWITDRVGQAGGGGGIGTGEAEVNQDTFLMLADRIVKEFVDEVLNKQIVDHLVFMNFGEQALKQSRTKVKATGLSPATRDLFKQLINQVMQQEAILENGGTLKLSDMIDGVGVLKSMGIPLRPQEELEQIAAEKKERRDAFGQRIAPEEDEEEGSGHIDDKKVTRDLEDEGVLDRGTEEPDEVDMSRLRRIDLGLKGGTVSIYGDQVVHVLAIIKAAAAWEIPRGAAKEALTLMGVEDADTLLGNAGKGNRPKKDAPPDPAPTVALQLPEKLATELELKVPVPVVNYHAPPIKIPEIKIPAIKIPPVQIPQELTRVMEKIGVGIDSIRLHLAAHVDGGEEEIVDIEKDPKTGKKRFRIKRKKGN